MSLVIPQSLLIITVDPFNLDVCSGLSLQVLSFPEFSSSSVFHMPSSSLRDPLAPPLLLTSPTPEYPPEDASPSAHTSASLIKAIREELRRLAQKQVAVTSYP